MKKLRIGLLVDQFEVPLWVYRVADQNIKSDYAEVSLIIVKNKFSNSRSWLHRIVYSPQTLLYAAYVRVDKLFFSSKKMHIIGPHGSI